MGGNTIELGYQSVQTASGTADETDTTARLTTSLGGAAVKVGYGTGKIGADKSTTTEISVSQSVVGASLFLDIQNHTGNGTSGTNMALGTTVSF